MLAIISMYLPVNWLTVVLEDSQARSHCSCDGSGSVDRTTQYECVAQWCQYAMSGDDNFVAASEDMCTSSSTSSVNLWIWVEGANELITEQRLFRCAVNEVQITATCQQARTHDRLH